jgi:hypothetical protein
VKKKNVLPVCRNHPGADAVYQCGNCLETLCEQCVKQDAHWFFCTLCGAQAQRIARKAPRESVSIKENLAPAAEALKGLVSVFTNHILVPAAVIAMVGAFLFYLAEVRTVFLGDSSSLKRVGFLFGAATVLIARYGKTYGQKGRQAIYTGLLGLAAIIALSRYSAGGLNFMVSVVILIAVWRFATGVTNNLDLEEAEKKKDDYRLYGVERLKHEAVERQYGLKHEAYTDAPGLERKKKKKKKRKRKGSKKPWDAHGNPSAPVARLVVIALVLFALGEPLILSGPPDIGGRALAYVIIFLLASGIVLAAGSAMGTFRHTVISGGDASLSMVPIKITIGVILLVAIMAVAFTMPGINYEGSGKLQPTQYRTTGNTAGQEDNVNEKSRKGGDTRDKPSSERQARSETQRGDKSPPSFIDMLVNLGKVLIFPLIAIMVVIGLFVFIKLLPHLRNARFGILDRLKKLLEKLRRSRAGRKKDDEAAVKKKNPLKILKTIQGLPPREAVLGAYECLLAFFEQVGHQRMARLTPYEFLYSLPEQLAYLAGPAGKVTELYVRTAYSRHEPTSADSLETLEALQKVRQLIDTRESKK